MSYCIELLSGAVGHSSQVQNTLLGVVMVVIEITLPCMLINCHSSKTLRAFDIDLFLILVLPTDYVYHSA